MTAPCVASAAMWSPTQRASPRRRFLLAVASLTMLLSAAFFSPRRGQASASAAFIGARAPRAAVWTAPSLAPRGQQVALAAEPEIVDAEMEPAAEAEPKKETSVFDGKRSDIIKRKYDGKYYRVSRSTWTYTMKNRQTKQEETGKWNPAWSMPEEEFVRREPELRKQYLRKKRKLRIKHGRGQRWPNGKLIHLTKLQGSPFTRQMFGEKYVGRAPWHFSPKEVEHRAQQMRAQELKRRLEFEASATRYARLRELGVWSGDLSWRKPWQPQVDLADLGSWKKQFEEQEEKKIQEQNME